MLHTPSPAFRYLALSEKLKNSSACSAVLGKRLTLCKTVKSHERHSFFERDPRGREYPREPSAYSLTELAIRGVKLLKKETKLWISEVREDLRMDPKMYRHGDTEVIYRFDSEESLKNWKVGMDSSYKEGKSECSLIVNSHRKGVFSGTIDTSLPKDGKVKRAGFCTMRSKKLLKSFRRPDAFNWYPFTHLEMRLRGDGRVYNILLGLSNYTDVQWLDIYMYGLFTHGGPYWQTVRVPFSKFFLTSKGRIQDKQHPLPKAKVNSIGITCAKTPGPFRLEIDYIGVHRDISEKESFAYELYNYPKWMVSN